MKAETSKSTEVTKQPEPQKNITEIVLARVTQFQQLGELRIPKDYSPENALKSAYLILTDMQVNGQPVLQQCTKESIANALLNMVVQGLSPMKKQGAFIAYGNKLSWQTEYHGNIALAKRYGNVKEVTGNVIYEGDTFKYTIDPETGRKKIISHEQEFENIDNNKIKGAYATLILEDGSTFVEIMNMTQIRQAWMQGAAKGQSPAHKNFPDQMAAKTVINRACKLFISTSDDAAIIPDDETSESQSPVMQTVTERANKEVVNFEDAEEVPITPGKDEKSEPQSDTKVPEPANEEKEVAPGAPKLDF